jgi:hypothetical protein
MAVIANQEAAFEKSMLTVCRHAGLQSGSHPHAGNEEGYEAIPSGHAQRTLRRVGERS